MCKRLIRTRITAHYFRESVIQTEPSNICEVAGLRRGTNEFFRLLGYYAALGGLKPTFRDHLSGPIFNGQASSWTAVYAFR